MLYALSFFKISFKLPVVKSFFSISNDNCPLTGNFNFLSYGYIEPNPYKFFLAKSKLILKAVALAFSPLILDPPTFNSLICISILLGSIAGTVYSLAESCLVKPYLKRSFFFPSRRCMAGI